MGTKLALILGGSTRVWDDYYGAKIFCNQQYDCLLGINNVIGDIPEKLDIAVTLHPEKIQLWLAKRKANSFLGPDKVVGHRLYYDYITHVVDYRWDTTLKRHNSGSSGLFAIKVALDFGFDKIILCGVGLDHTQGHYFNDKPWDWGNTFRESWITYQDKFKDNVRSMSGWTQEFLGKPTLDWLKGNK